MEDLEERAGAHLAHTRPEIVVAYKHIDLVSNVLSERGVKHSLIETHEVLGLGLIRLDQSDASVAEKFSEWAPDGTPDEEWLHRTRWPHDPSSEDLDRFLRGLRGYFRMHYSGWSPLVGKNRLVGNVEGAPGKISHGGGGELRATEDFFAQRALRSRQSATTTDVGVPLDGTGVLVGVIDTGIFPNPWLDGAWTSPPGPGVPADQLTDIGLHATFVAGLVLDQAPGATLIVRSVLDSATGQATSWDVAKAIVDLAQVGPHIMNLSLVGYTEDGEAPLVLAAAIDRVPPSTMIVAAAGNHGDLEKLPADEAASSVDDATEKSALKAERRKPAWPAALDRVIAVGSATEEGPEWRRSDFTPRKAKWIDVLAPGDGVISTFTDQPVRNAAGPFNGFAEWGGTSFAAASLSGAIAARTVPGRISPHEAWQALKKEEVELTAEDPPFIALPSQFRRSGP